MISTRLSLVLTAFLLALSLSALHAGTELLTNGNFDAGKNGWTLDTLKGAKGTLEFDRDPDGKASAHITVPEAAAEPYYVQLFRAV